MRRIRRLPLPPGTTFALLRKQVTANRLRAEPDFEPSRLWGNARKSKAVRAAETTLQDMAGCTERCMYCEDSHGSDIEHFWPKSTYPERLFVWRNLLLCCAECGRLKGKQFPLDETNDPLLLDPTSDDPWQHLDFDPETGNIVPRFDIERNAFSRKGDATVAILNLDRREALARVYLRTYRRLVKIALEAIDDPDPNADRLVKRLQATDDNGLIAWCIHGTGKTADPFRALRDTHPDVWDVCRERLP